MLTFFVIFATYSAHKMKKIVIASDSFKGSLTSKEVAEAVCRGINRILPDCKVVSICLGDGGEGTAEAIASFVPCNWMEVIASDPIGRKISARYAVCDNEGIKTAIIELASASGLTLLKDSERNPLYTSTFGTGEMILDAIRNGCRKFIIGIGGSATNDAGTGMLEALGFRFIDSEGNIIKGCNGLILNKIRSIDASKVPEEVLSSSFTVACDVRAPFYGNDGATRIFAAQKGAGKEEIEILEQGMSSFAAMICNQYGINLQDIPGSGAAGGVGGALYAFLGAGLTSGADLVLDYAGFEDAIKDADLIITGEGKIDSQTFRGKLPAAIHKRATAGNVPVAAIGGIVDLDDKDIARSGFLDILAIQPVPESPEELARAMDPATATVNISRTIREFLVRLLTRKET